MILFCLEAFTSVFIMSVKEKIRCNAWIVNKCSIFSGKELFYKFQMPRHLAILIALQVLKYAFIVTKQGWIISWK